MAPHKAKRTDSSKVVPLAKKAKLQAPAPDAAFEDPLAQQLAPILSALAASELPESCCEIFRVALPLCVGVASEERHTYQNKILDLAASSLKGLEVARRAALAEVEAKAENLKNEGLVARADAETAKDLATSKQQESDAKGAEAAQIASEVSAAKLELTAELAQRDALLASKAALVGEQGDFHKLLETTWEPLKVAQWAGQAWRKRDKVVAELTDKLTPLALDASLVDALLAAIKIRPEQRQGFALRAVGFAEEAFARHTATFAEKIAGTSAEEEAHETAVAEAERKLAELQARHAAKDKECDELQNAWAELETNANKALSAAAAFDTEIRAALAAGSIQKGDLEAALAVSAALATLKEPPAPRQEGATAPEAPLVETPPAPVELAPAMEVEVEAAAACA